MILAAVLSLALTAEPPDAATAKAKQLFSAGQKLYTQGKFTDAVTKFQEAYAIRQRPAILFNLAKCYEQLDDTPKAMRSYREYLRLAPDANDKDQVLDGIANLERKLKERGLQQLVIYAEPTAAEVELDGTYVGNTPVWIELTQGAHKIVARAQKFQTIERTYTMSLTRAQELTLNLTPAGEAKPVEPASTTTTTASTTTTKPSDAPVATTITPSTSTSPSASITTTPSAAPRKRVWSWLGLGVTGAAGITSIVSAVLLATSSNSFYTDPKNSPDQRKSLFGTMEVTAPLALGTGIAAGVAAIVTVILFVAEGS